MGPDSSTDDMIAFMCEPPRARSGRTPAVPIHAGAARGASPPPCPERAPFLKPSADFRRVSLLQAPASLGGDAHALGPELAPGELLLVRADERERPRRIGTERAPCVEQQRSLP